MYPNCKFEERRQYSIADVIPFWLCHCGITFALILFATPDSAEQLNYSQLLSKYCNIACYSNWFDVQCSLVSNDWLCIPDTQLLSKTISVGYSTCTKVNSISRSRQLSHVECKMGNPLNVRCSAAVNDIHFYQFLFSTRWFSLEFARSTVSYISLLWFVDFDRWYSWNRFRTMRREWYLITKIRPLDIHGHLFPKKIARRQQHKKKTASERIIFTWMKSNKC